MQAIRHTANGARRANASFLRLQAFCDCKPYGERMQAELGERMQAELGDCKLFANASYAELGERMQAELGERMQAELGGRS